MNRSKEYTKILNSSINDDWKKTLEMQEKSDNKKRIGNDEKKFFYHSTRYLRAEMGFNFSIQKEN